jgi:hypothetical protein
MSAKLACSLAVAKVAYGVRYCRWFGVLSMAARRHKDAFEDDLEDLESERSNGPVPVPARTAPLERRAGYGRCLAISRLIPGRRIDQCLRKVGIASVSSFQPDMGCSGPRSGSLRLTAEGSATALPSALTDRTSAYRIPSRSAAEVRLRINNLRP